MATQTGPATLAQPLLLPVSRNTNKQSLGKTVDNGSDTEVGASILMVLILMVPEQHTLDMYYMQRASVQYSYKLVTQCYDPIVIQA